MLLRMEYPKHLEGNEMIRCIIFDLGGVVVTDRNDLIEDEVASYLRIGHSRFSELIKDLKPLVTSGNITLLEMYSTVIKQLDLDIRAEDVLEKHVSTYERVSAKKDYDILELVFALGSRYHVVALTNTESEIFETNKRRGLIDFLSGYFEKVYASSEMGMRKPQAEIYRSVLKDLGYQPEECIFIDDKEDYVEGAHQVGLKAILYKSREQLVKELASFSVTV